MKALLIVSVLGLASLSAAQSTQTFAGVITDDMCAQGWSRDHAHGSE